MMTKLTHGFLGLSLWLLAAACNNLASAAAQSSASPVVQTKQGPQAAQPAAPAQVAKIVFVGKQNACDCTKKSIAAAWDTLQKTLGQASKLPVEQLYIDTQGAQVMLYRKQKPMMALPAIYFLDGKNKVLELLQGEVTEAQITTALKK